jgi:hypothetical protein
MDMDMTTLTVDGLLIMTNIFLIVEGAADQHALRKIALGRARRRLARMVAADAKRNPPPAAETPPAPQDAP